MRFGYECRLAVSPNQISCDLAGEAAILNLRDGVYYGLDAVGSRLWALLQEGKSYSEILHTLLTEFDVSAEALDSDLQEILEKLVSKGLVELVP